MAVMISSRSHIVVYVHTKAVIIVEISKNTNMTGWNVAARKGTASFDSCETNFRCENVGQGNVESLADWMKLAKYTLWNLKEKWKARGASRWFGRQTCKEWQQDREQMYGKRNRNHHGGQEFNGIGGPMDAENIFLTCFFVEKFDLLRYRYKQEREARGGDQTNTEERHELVVHGGTLVPQQGNQLGKEM